jgi:hypothetical protein
MHVTHLVYDQTIDLVFRRFMAEGLDASLTDYLRAVESETDARWRERPPADRSSKAPFLPRAAAA